MFKKDPVKKVHVAKKAVVQPKPEPPPPPPVPRVTAQERITKQMQERRVKARQSDAKLMGEG
jgi:hypothetical protein